MLKGSLFAGLIGIRFLFRIENYDMIGSVGGGRRKNVGAEVEKGGEVVVEADFQVDFRICLNFGMIFLDSWQRFMKKI